MFIASILPRLTDSSSSLNLGSTSAPSESAIVNRSIAICQLCSALRRRTSFNFQLSKRRPNWNSRRLDFLLSLPSLPRSSLSIPFPRTVRQTRQLASLRGQGRILEVTINETRQRLHFIDSLVRMENKPLEPMTEPGIHFGLEP